MTMPAKSVRECARKLISHVESAESGYIPGCGNDLSWRARRDELVADLRLALSDAPDDRVLDQAWHAVSKKQPPPHAKYEVYRAGVGDFEATPCYGLHSPWWVPDGRQPIDMLPGDMWRALAASEPKP